MSSHASFRNCERCRALIWGRNECDCVCFSVWLEEDGEENAARIWSRSHEDAAEKCAAGIFCDGGDPPWDEKHVFVVQAPENGPGHYSCLREYRVSICPEPDIRWNAREVSVSDPFPRGVPGE